MRSACHNPLEQALHVGIFGTVLNIVELWKVVQSRQVLQSIEHSAPESVEAVPELRVFNFEL